MDEEEVSYQMDYSVLESKGMGRGYLLYLYNLQKIQHNCHIWSDTLCYIAEYIKISVAFSISTPERQYLPRGVNIFKLIRSITNVRSISHNEDIFPAMTPSVSKHLD